MLAKVKPGLINTIEFIISGYAFTYRDLAKNILFNTEKLTFIKSNLINGQLYFQDTNIENIIIDKQVNYGINNLKFDIILTTHSNVKYVIENLYLSNIYKNKIDFIGSFQCKYNFDSINDLLKHLTVVNIKKATDIKTVEISKHMQYYLDILE